jgi:maleylacetoacetate isomerase
MTMPIFYGYYRSSAAYRVRIALGLKRVAFETRAVQLLKGEQSGPDYLKLNPQGLVPALFIDGVLLAQSEPIVEYLDETRPEPPLLPNEPKARAQARRLAQMIVADIHPLNNTRVLAYLKTSLGQGEDAVDEWVRHWILAGFGPLERMLAGRSSVFCHGEQPGLADLCLIPQLYNARRFAVDLADFPNLVEIERRCLALPAFQAAHPDRQADSPNFVKSPD